jgi:two-component sensor histidine kinase
MGKLILYFVFVAGWSLNICGQTALPVSTTNSPAALKADTLNLTARRYMLQTKHDSAKIFLDAAIELALASKEPAIIARCYVDYANMYNLRSKFSEADKYIKLAKPYLAATDNYEVNITGILLQAHIFNMTGRKDSAIYYYRKAEAYNISRGQFYRNYVVYMSLGELYNQLNDFEPAEDNFDKAYELTAKKEGRPDHGYLLIVYINYHLTRNKPEGAGKLIAEYDALMEERKKNKFNDPLKNVIMNLTGNRLENSIEFMKEVREDGLRNKEINHTIIADVYITRYYEKKKDYEQAIRYITEAEQLAAEASTASHLYEARKLKFGLLQKAGKNEEAAVLAESLFTMKDSMLALEKREQLYELEKKFETEKKEKEITLLASQKQLDSKTIALLTSDKRLAELLLQQRLLQNQGLERENILMDSIVKSEKAFSTLLASENSFKEDKLRKEKELMQSLTRENILKSKQVKKERQTKWLLAGGALLVLVSGLSIFSLYKKQKNKNLIIQKQSEDLEVLMKEIHHRVKNNLQIVSSLLDLQGHYITDAQASEAVKEGKNRVQSMALIHQNLYSEGNIKGIEVKGYINNLLDTLCTSYNISNDKVKINASIDNLNLDVDTMIPLGLVINELVSNAFKYAFKEKQSGELDIVLKENEDKLLLLVKDNGAGFPAGLDVKNSKSFGLKMIKAFAQKLKAKLDIYNKDGAVVEMEIAKFKLV